MPSIVTNKTKITNAKNFVSNLEDETNNVLYVFLGRPNAWPDDKNPPIPGDTLENTSRIWDEVLGLKRILARDVKNVIRRVDWQVNEIYDAYDNLDPNLYTKRFYVLNKDFDVYKCISNNGNSRSLVQPTGKNANIFTTADGYRWKYIYSIPTADQLRFLTRNWMPVVIDEAVSELAKDGAIEQILLFGGGTEYSFDARVVIEGDGANVLITPKNRIGVIYDFNYVNTGEKYRYANAYITDTTGRYANIRAIVSPPGGHGYDPIVELNAHHVMLSARTEFNEGFGDIPPNVKFRRIGLVKNPRTQNNILANALTLSGYYSVKIGGANGSFIQDEYINGAQSNANAFSITTTVDSTGNTFLRYIQTDGFTKNFTSFRVGELITGQSSGTTGTVLEVIPPEVMHDTGDIIYLENRTPITRSLDQAEILHLVIEF
jgi:hypothetical protein